MYKDISVQLVSLLYIVILSVVYFLKRKYNFLESKVYKSLLVSTIISLILDIVSMCILECGMFSDFVIAIFSKLYFISLFVWIVLFIFYILLNKTLVKYDNYKTLIKNSCDSEKYASRKNNMSTIIIYIFSKTKRILFLLK